MSIVVFSVLAGLIWGGLVGLANMLVTRKMMRGGANMLTAMSLVRTFVDVAALAAVYFTRDLLPLRFEVVLITTAVVLSLVTIVVSFRLSASLKK
jgi:hypothetical protein